MTIGNPSQFAIESGISEAYSELGLRALGYFVLYVGGLRYGIHQPDATLLACSYDSILERLARRGTHTAPFALHPCAGDIADAFCFAIYAPDQESDRFLELNQLEFENVVYGKHLKMAPDGDEAFDDGSFVLQFDIEDRVRLIAFRFGDDYHHDTVTIRDAWLSADLFYGILCSWADAFYTEWSYLPKRPSGYV